MADILDNVDAILRLNRLPSIPAGEITDVQPDRFRSCGPVTDALWNAITTSGQFCASGLAVRRLHGPTAEASYRESVTYCALQAVQHADSSVEWDVDLGGAKTDLVGLLIHGWEVISHLWGTGKTNQERVAKWIKKYRGDANG